MKKGLTMPKLIFLLLQVCAFAVIAVAATGHFGMADGMRVTAAYLVRADIGEAKAGDDAAEVRWWPLNALPPLAFDHDAVIAAAIRLVV